MGVMKTGATPIRTLVVEDNPTDALLLEEMLREVSGAAFDTTCVERLDQALALLAAAHFEVVLLDLSLPDSQGPDTLVRVRRNQPEVPIVVLTGLDDEVVGMKAVQLGAQDYLVKGRCSASLVGRSVRYAIERHHSALALRESEARLSALIRSALDPIITLNDQQRITLFNPAAEHTFGCKAREVVGQAPERLVPERFRSSAPDQQRLFGQIDLTQWRPGELELIYGLRADGTEFPMEASISPVHVMGQKFFTAILRDISERRRAEDAMMAQLWDSAIAEERNRMAGEIHDTLAQGFAGILFQLEAARDIAAENPREAIPYIERAEGLARSSLAEARRSVWALRPPELESQGLVGAVQVFLNRITAGTATKINFSVRGKPYPLQNEASLGLLRICQEAVVNALRHARASEIQIELAYQPSDVDLSVQDNGRGLDLQLSGKSEGFGLISMRERAERIGAHFEVSGEPGKGTRLTVVAPSPMRELGWQAP